MTVDLSVLIYTAREDYPYLGRPGLHCFDPVLETLTNQNFRHFELVIVDALYEQRSNFFADHKNYFRITHVPASPNAWHSRGRPGLCAQLNRGLAWCDGKLVWIGAENNLYPPSFLQKAWDVYLLGHVPVAWYAILGGPEEERGLLSSGALAVSGSSQMLRTPWRYPEIKFSLCGWDERWICDVDHRAERFADDPNVVLAPCHHQNYFAYAGIPLELAYELNGFDETLDGDLTALDVDMGSRITMLRGDDALAMHRDLWLMEPPTVERWAGGLRRRDQVKCGYAIWWYNRLRRRTRVNTPYPEGWIDDVKQEVCHGACEIRERCARGDPTISERFMFPFCESPDRESTRFWLDNLSNRSLEEDAEKRRRGEHPFDRFTRSTVT